MTKEPHVTAEIVKLQEGGTCFTLAYWYRTEDGYSLRFVGDRPFVYSGGLQFFALASFGQKKLDEYFALQ